MSTMGSADTDTGLVAQLNADWRVVECRDHQQWILQRRGSPKKPRRNDWRGRSYCRTADALRRCTCNCARAIDPTAAAILAAMPPRIDDGKLSNSEDPATAMPGVATH
jgi:hypothetical protein